MATASASPVVLIPPVRQHLWGWPAVANFFLGGLGAGFYALAVLDARLGASPAVLLAAWLGPALVLGGFAAVAFEAGRPLRGIRVLARTGTSWMSRELVLGGAFAALALLEFVEPTAAARGLAAVFGLALAVAQGFIVRRARAVPAWDVGAVPLVFLASSLLSGAALLLAVEALGGRAARGDLLGVVLTLPALGLVVWLGYVTWSREPAFVRATERLRVGPHALTIVAGGYVAPFVCLALAVPFPALATPAALAAAVLVLAGQAWAKAYMILAAGELRAIVLDPGLDLRRRAS